MAKIIARNAEVFAGGRNISGHSNSATLTLSAEAPEVTVFQNTARSRLGGGLRDVALSVNSFWDAAASTVDDTFNSLLSASALCGFYPSSASAGYAGREFSGILTSYETALAVADAAATTIAITGSPPLLYTNSIIHTSLTAQGTASAATTGVDFSGSATSAWGVWRLLALTGTSPEISACLQDSADNSTWVTEIVFTTASQANTTGISSWTSASRYRRLKYQFAGTSPFTATLHASSGSEV